MALTSDQIDRYSKILSHSQLFHGLEEAAIKALVQQGEIKSHTDGAIILEEEGRVTGLNVILEGAAKVIKGSTSLTVLGRGSFFGEISLFGVSFSATASIVSHEKTTLLVIPKTLLETWAKKFPKAETEFLRLMCQELCRRLYSTSERAR